MEELVLHHLVLQEWSRGAVKSSASKKKKKKSVQYHDDIMTESEVGTHQHKVIGIACSQGAILEWDVCLGKQSVGRLIQPFTSVIGIYMYFLCLHFASFSGCFKMSTML